MRSVHAPRVLHDATVELDSGAVARAINLSVGGIFVAADAPLEPGAHIRMKVNLLDGKAPVAVDGEVVWKADHGMALRFLGLDDQARLRIQQLVKKREHTIVARRDVRIHLPSLSAPLRASARDLSERGIMVEAELPWLRLGSPVTTELSPDRAADGRVQWIGLDVTRSGAARLRIFVDLAESIAGDPMLNVPPKEVLESLGGFIPLVQGRSPLRWAWPAVARGWADRYRAITPVACGAAQDVAPPSSVAVPPPARAAVTFWPGAYRSTHRPYPEP
jgi:Tfp pilus assembly protein PilZ